MTLCAGIFVHYTFLMPYEPVTIGLKFQIRVDDLTARDALIVVCPDCHARFTVAPHVLHERYHPMKRLCDLEHDLVCKSCKAKGDLKWHIVRAKGPEWPRSA